MPRLHAQPTPREAVWSSLGNLSQQSNRAPTSCLCDFRPFTQTLKISVSFLENGDNKNTCLLESLHRWKEIIHVECLAHTWLSFSGCQLLLFFPSSSKVSARSPLPQCPPLLGGGLFFFPENSSLPLGKPASWQKKNTQRKHDYFTRPATSFSSHNSHPAVFSHIKECQWRDVNFSRPALRFHPALTGSRNLMEWKSIRLWVL